MKDALSSNDTFVLLQTGTYGGCLTLYCDQSSEVKQFQLNMIDWSASVLGDADSSHRDSPVMNSVEEAFSYLDRYPWHQFTPHVIHPDVQPFVWEVINKRFEQGLVSPSTMAQWKRSCVTTDRRDFRSSTGRDSGIHSTSPRAATNVVNISTRLIGGNGTACAEFDDTRGVAPLSSPHIAWADAKHFRRAVECRLAELDHDGSYRIHSDQASDVPSEGQLDCGRPIRVVRTPEHVIGVAAMARLHLDFGWPRECLTYHLHGSSLSITASLLPKSRSVHVVCDVRKTVDEVARLVANVTTLCRRMPLPSRLASEEGCAAQRWVENFQQDCPPLFWAIGPSGVSTLYQLSYLDGCIEFDKVADVASRLTYPGTRCAISGWRSAESAVLSG